MCQSKKFPTYKWSKCDLLCYLDLVVGSELKEKKFVYPTFHDGEWKCIYLDASVLMLLKSVLLMLAKKEV